MNAEIDITCVVLKTSRLLLRPWKMSDLDDFYEYAKVDGVGQMAGWLPHKNKEELKQVLTKFIENKRTFAIVYDNKVIGSIEIKKYNENNLKEFSNLKGRELGYVLSKDYWGNGLMTEAVKKVIEYLFNIVKLDFIVCGHFLNNDRSRRVQEKCGFVHYKTFKYETSYGKIVDSWTSILLNNQNKQ